MADRKPDWYKGLSHEEKPRLWMFSRADAFDKNADEKVNIILKELSCDHINIGLDGFSDESIRLMNKGIHPDSKQLKSNFNVCELLCKENANFSIGGVLNHIGITKEIMEKNYENIAFFINKYASNINP